MIICHCSCISDHEVHAAIDWMRAADPEVLITPGRVYRALGKSADCGGCVSLFIEAMRKNPNLAVPKEVPNLRHTPNRGDVEAT